MIAGEIPCNHIMLTEILYGSLKKRYWIPLTILLLITTLSVCGWRYWISFKQQQGITVDWKNINISFDGISFDEFTFTKQSLLTVKSKHLHISLSKLVSNDIDIYWLSNEENQLASINNESENQTAIDNSFLTTVFYWLPNVIHIDSLRFYEQNSESFNIKIDTTKQQEGMQLVVSNNNKDAMQLSAILTLNQPDSQIDVQSGLLTATLNDTDIINGKLTAPFIGWIKADKLFFTNADNALISLNKWTLSPDLTLTNVEGKINFQIESPIPFYSEQAMFSGQLTVDKLNGSYKQGDIKSLTGNGTVTIKNNQLTISATKINIKEVNLGIIFQNIKLIGTYLAPINALTEGVITWNQAQANIFSGTVSLEKNKLNLAKLPHQLNVKLKQIQLKDILSTYPVDGFAGEGVVEGYVTYYNIENPKNGVTVLKTSIKNGQLATVQDGFLQFENAALRDYVQNNPQMKIVTDVMKNFHYTKLTGNLDYQDDIAKLKLNIQGRNPEAENGKAVNLNITLEENIPKLIMSLQLSDQISEPIRKRIEERLK